MTEAIAQTSFDDFLAAEICSEARHELVGGRVYVITGGTERHDLAAQALWETLVGGARSKGAGPSPATGC